MKISYYTFPAITYKRNEGPLADEFFKLSNQVERIETSLKLFIFLYKLLDFCLYYLSQLLSENLIHDLYFLFQINCLSCLKD